MDDWDVVVDGRFQLQIKVVGEYSVILYKPRAEWSDDDKKKVQYDLKTRNILIYSLGINEYQSISHCKTSKAMWDSLYYRNID